MSKLLKIEQIDKLIKEMDKRNKLKIQTESDRALNAEKELDNKVQKVEDMLGGKSLRYVTQVEYDTLSEEDKNNPNISWAITDAEDLSHTHDNMDILNSITQERMESWDNVANKEIPDNIATDEELNEVRDMFGGKSIKYITQAEYDILTEEERNSDTVTYFITDAVDLSHEHENKEFLDGLSQEVLDAEYIKAVDYDESEITIVNEGFILLSPNGIRFKLTVDDEGNLSTEKL